MKLKVPIAIVAAGGLLAGSTHRLDAQTDDASQPPVEFTACAGPGPAVQTGTEGPVSVSLPDGELTLDRRQGFTWQLTVTDVSDPRFEGTWYQSNNFDAYTGPHAIAGLGLELETFRIENDEGAWQGSIVVIDWPDGVESSPSENGLVMIGEGAYEGLTAVMRWSGSCPGNIRGYIVELPETPAPPTGEL